ncbi:MAG TPA: DinB family protein [Anaerolineales bacterium]|nr:DinB family protein [Anaerolineales bacterium]
MQTFFKEYLKLLQACHNDILKALDELPQAALDWTPGHDMNSISVLLVHIAGSTRHMINVAVQEPSDRDREAEFIAQNLGADILRQRLADNMEHIQRVVEKLSLQDLETTHILPNGRDYPVAWGLLHALEHASLHLGQIQLNRQLWEQSKSST